MFLVGGFTTGGKERQLTTLIMHLPKDKYEVHLLMKSKDTYYFDVIKSELKSFCDLNKPHFAVNDILRINKYYHQVKPDIVFSFSTLMSHISLIIRLYNSLNFRLINGSIRNAPNAFNFYLKFERVLYNFYKEVVSNSIAGLISYKQYNKKGRYLLYNGFNGSRIPKKSKNELINEIGMKKGFIVLMVSNMFSRKDHTTFIRATKQILKTHQNIYFYIIGDGPKRGMYEEIVNNMKLNSNLCFVGKVNNVEKYFKAADLSVLASSSWYGEGIPNVVMESMACGTPVLATASGGIKELLIHGENGFLINPGDYKTLAERIVFLKNNVDVLERFRKNGISIVNNKFNTDEMINKFVEILDGVATYRDYYDSR